MRKGFYIFALCFSSVYSAGKGCGGCLASEPLGVSGFNEDETSTDSNGCLRRNITCFRPNYVTYKTSNAIVSQASPFLELQCNHDSKWVEAESFARGFNWPFSEVDCHNSTQPPKPKSVCSLPGNPKEEFTCLAYFPMWFYDKENNECKKFIYGGCGGNENRFGSKEECEKICKKEK
ncbi:unnamed protein product, partial [Mesorhabditis belari]|uniref:BPTI/Kunitz inhibitor domain-containing protein n=1 Tax=Mesorhabditis belari TaxID=2138241 RepID=A0AAF3EE33_9BILA